MKEFMKTCFDANPMARPTVEEVLSQLEKMVSASSVIEDEVYGTRKSTVQAPEGKVFILFTEFENSEILWEQHPNEMPEIIKMHNGFIRNMITRNFGYEVKSERESFMVAFSKVTNLISFCLDVQRGLCLLNWPSDFMTSEYAPTVYNSELAIFRGPRIKMGANVGQPRCAFDIVHKRMDYFGSIVIKASRLKSRAHGGEILISEDVLNELETSSYKYEADKHICRDMGTQKLKGLKSPIHVYSIISSKLEERHKYFYEKTGEDSSSSVAGSVGSSVDDDAINQGASSSDFQWELDLTKLEIGTESLGSGSYGELFLGRYMV